MTCDENTTIPSVFRTVPNFSYHSHLNSRLWDEKKDLKLQIRLRLLRGALAFYEFLDVPGLRVTDIILTGSNAAFNYTSASDVDVHLIVTGRVARDTLADNLFSTKKKLWGESRDVSVRGCPVEFYVETDPDSLVANGIYSILHGRWLKEAKPDRPAVDDSAVRAKTRHLMKLADHLLDAPDASEITTFMDRLKRMRTASLEKGGEFSSENLAFKNLRALGYLDALRDVKTSLEDKDLSLGIK